MNINSETKYCQTCGIPLDIDYTNLKADQNEEYCDYCLKNGVKLYDFSMDYLIYLWGLFPEEYSISFTNIAAPQTYINSLKSSLATMYTMIDARASIRKRIFSTFLILSGFIS